MRMDTKNPTVQWAAIGIGLLLIIVGAWWTLTQKRSSEAIVSAPTENSTVTETATATSKPTASASGEKVVAEDQGAGGSVKVASVSLTKTSWVAVKDAKGWVLGAARLGAGSHSNVTVPLLRATTAGINYYVVIFVDDGDNVFDHKKDAVLTNAAGTALFDNFYAN